MFYVVGKTKETSTNAFEKSLFIYPKINNKATTWKDYNERAPYLPTDNTKVKAASTYTTAKTNCKDNEQCIYDYVVTGNKDYADFTLALFKLSSQFGKFLRVAANRSQTIMLQSHGKMLFRKILQGEI